MDESLLELVVDLVFTVIPLCAFCAFGALVLGILWRIFKKLK